VVVVVVVVKVVILLSRTTKITLISPGMVPSGWVDLQVTPEELRPEFTLMMGQCFNWKRAISMRRRSGGGGGVVAVLLVVVVVV